MSSLSPNTTTNEEVVHDPDPAPDPAPALKIDQEDYEKLQQFYLEKRVRKGVNAELPGTGMRLRKQVRQSRIDLPPYKTLKKKLEILRKKGNHVERYRLLCLLLETTKQRIMVIYCLN
mmetsp:Transcript_6305/g.11909  ORF Transcript_6305/g.11909 Transcript_6305/m.11909 type:complete len:118 (+) Transcript_6305:671-1024(+)